MVFGVALDNGIGMLMCTEFMVIRGSSKAQVHMDP